MTLPLQNTKGTLESIVQVKLANQDILLLGAMKGTTELYQEGNRTVQ